MPDTEPDRTGTLPHNATAPQVVGPRLCEDCYTYPADWPSKLCPGCEAYREHTEWL